MIIFLRLEFTVLETRHFSTMLKRFRTKSNEKNESMEKTVSKVIYCNIWYDYRVGRYTGILFYFSRKTQLHPKVKN